MTDSGKGKRAHKTKLAAANTKALLNMPVIKNCKCNSIKDVEYNFYHLKLHVESLNVHLPV